VSRFLAIVAAAVLLTAALAVGAQAASPHQVDPAGMVPALNPQYGPWICTDTGAGPICRGDDAGAWANEETGLQCGDQPIYSTGDASANAVRWHLPDGRATRTFFENQDSETWTLTGADWQVTAPGYGLVWHDTGFVRFEPGSEDEIDFTHGPTGSDHGNLDLVLPAVCAILAG
jgi:hypothetical protein